ncbi:uncharacterized protein ISCGN_032097, partial [Ixodes scapularis]
SPAHARFTDVVASKSLLKDLRQLSPETQTYGLESFHSVLNSFAPKSAAFSTKGMLTRTRIATLHWNENANREQAVTKAGQLQFKVKSPKARKGHHTAHPEKTKATHGNLGESHSLVVWNVLQHHEIDFYKDHNYVAKLVTQAVAVCKEIGPLKEVFELEAKTPRLSSMTESFDRPLKEDLVAARISRFGKKPPNAAD